jgi:hypothetical protein
MCDPELYHLPDGREVCQICVEIKTRDELQPVKGKPGVVWDVCKDCAERENTYYGADY